MFDKYHSLQFPKQRQRLRSLRSGNNPDVVDLGLVRRKYPGSSSLQTKLFEFRDAEQIKKELASGVIRVWTGSRKTRKSRSFVVKYALAGSSTRHEALKKEAKIYHEHLEALQGRDVPSFFGLYEGRKPDATSRRSIRVTCIILEDCGDRFEGYWFHLPRNDRAEILMKIGNIHLCGVSVYDLPETGVVQKDGLCRLVDFQHVEVGHDCSWTGVLPLERLGIPSWEEIGCPDILELGLQLGIWKQDKTVKIYGATFPRSEYPSQDAIDILCHLVRLVNEDDKEPLRKWIKGYKKHEDRMTSSQYYESFPRPKLSLSWSEKSKEFFGRSTRK